jgi:Flp pilus assembly protein CpaB
VFALGGGLVLLFAAPQNARAGSNRASSVHPATATPPKQTFNVTTPTAATVTVPADKQGLVVSLPVAQGLGGYVSPGDTVNIYANVSKVTEDKLIKTGLISPCTGLVEPNVLVLDVNPRPAQKSGNQSSTASTQPTGQSANVTYLLAVDSNIARTIIFFQSNESLYMTLVPHGQSPTGTLPCVSYAQEVQHP